VRIVFNLKLRGRVGEVYWHVVRIWVNVCSGVLVNSVVLVLWAEVTEAPGVLGWGWEIVLR
jgi:hypothetical protein